jgi:hypothetical protein
MLKDFRLIVVGILVNVYACRVERGCENLARISNIVFAGVWRV